MQQFIPIRRRARSMFTTRRSAPAPGLFTSLLLLGVMMPLADPMAQSGPGHQRPPPPIDRPSPVPASPTGVGAIDDAIAIVGEWLDRANREYRDVVDRDLKVPTDKALEAERAKQKPPAPQPRQPLEQAAKPAETPQAPANVAASTDDATRARQRAAEEARARAALQGTSPQSPQTATRTDGPRLEEPQTQAEVQRKREEEARKEAERRESERRMAEKRENERKDAERLDAERREKERVVAEKREAERREAERRDAERVVAEKREAERRTAERVDAEKREAERKAREARQSPSVGAAPRIPSAGELAEEATKAGTAALKSLEKQLERARTAAQPDELRKDPVRSSERRNEKPGREVAEAGSSVAPSGREARASARNGSRRGNVERCQRAGYTIDPPGIYVVQRGDTLWSIARRHYDRGIRYHRIVRANPGKISNPNLIFPCQRFQLPALQRAQLLIEWFAPESPAGRRLMAWNGLVPDTFSIGPPSNRERTDGALRRRTPGHTSLNRADRISTVRP